MTSILAGRNAPRAGGHGPALVPRTSRAVEFAAHERPLPVALSETPEAPRSITPRARRSGCARALWLSRNALDHLSGVLVFPLQGDVGLRNHADETIVFGGDGQTPHLVLRHNLERF